MAKNMYGQGVNIIHIFSTRVKRHVDNVTYIFIQLHYIYIVQE